MCKHEFTRADCHTEEFYLTISLVIVESCIKCGEKIDESRQVLGSK